MAAPPPFLNTRQLAEELAARPGLIPVEVQGEQRQLVWLDCGTYHGYDGFFFRNLQAMLGLMPAAAEFISTVESLGELSLPGPLVPPTGFIHHVGRCGSTLLTCVLARSRRHLVYGEAKPHNQIWNFLGSPWPPPPTPDALHLYRQLVLVMNRRRLPGYTASFIKYANWNVGAWRFIRAAFPGTPELFVYRDPLEVLVSCAKGHMGFVSDRRQPFLTWATGLTAEQTHACSDLDLERRIVVQCFTAGREACAAGMRCVEYPHITAANLPALLDFFGVSAPADELALMQSQFAFYSKGGKPAQPFTPDAADKRRTASPEVRAAAAGELAELYEELRRSPANLFPTGGSSANP